MTRLSAIFLTSKNNFEKYLEEATVLADSAEVKDILSRVRDLHRAYQALFEEEVAAVKAGKFDPEEHSLDKERIVNEALEELTELRTLNQQSIFRKVKDLDEAGAKARTVAGVITGWPPC